MTLEIPRLKKVKDLFIFSCYTGVSYADLIVLTPQNLVIGMDKKIMVNHQEREEWDSG